MIVLSPDPMLVWLINEGWFYIFNFYSLFVFLGLHLQHTEVPRLGVESELQLPAYSTTTATPDPSRVCNLQHSWQQHLILNPWSKAGDWTCILMDMSQMCFRWAMMGTLILHFSNHWGKKKIKGSITFCYMPKCLYGIEFSMCVKSD